MTAAFRNASAGTEYRNAFSSRLVAADWMPCISTKKVLVLMPPPVEPGEAPMNISTISTSSPALEKPERA